jgi:hypothetical protein
VRDPDPQIQQLEDELRRSQFEKWDVETLLADRHRAKIEALTSPDKRGAKLQVAREIAETIFSFVGKVTTISAFGVWLLSGFPLP